MELPLALSIVGTVIAIASFVLARKDKAVNDTKEEASEQRLIEYRLDQLSKKVDKILEKLENQETEIKRIVDEEIEKHVLQYHKGSY
jgi:peptidoglycan hydrolase CwlO-like protein